MKYLSNDQLININGGKRWRGEGRYFKGWSFARCAIRMACNHLSNNQLIDHCL